MEEKDTLVAWIWFETSAEVSSLIQIFCEKLYFFLKNYITSHFVLYYQQLSNARYQVSFYANNYFE